MADEPVQHAENVAVYVNGRRFACDCGANVLTKIEQDRYRCNACGDLYTGALTDGLACEC